MDNLYIPKNKTTVEILLNFDEKPYIYTLYLNKSSRLGVGEESLNEFLNSGRNFIPATEKATGETEIVNIDNIIYVKDMKSIEKSTENMLELYLTNNQSMIVEHFENLPLSHSRPLDALNDERNFLPYLIKSKVIYINKKNIAKVVG